MSVFGDILQALEKWPKWRKIVDTPERVDALEARVAVLEGLLNEKRPHPYCPACGARAFKAAYMATDKAGRNRVDRACADCGFTGFGFE